MELTENDIGKYYYIEGKSGVHRIGKFIRMSSSENFPYIFEIFKTRYIISYHKAGVLKEIKDWELALELLE